MIKNIVWDVDRTMVDSYHCEMASLKQAIINALDREYPQDLFEQLTVLPTHKFFGLLNITEEEKEKINKEWDKEYSKNPPRCFDGVKESIKELSPNYNLCVVTSRTIDEYHELDYEIEDLFDYFNEIVTSDKVEKPKPAPDSMEYLYHNYNYLPEETVYIGDSEIDCQFCKNSKCHFIQAIWDREPVENAEYTAKTPKDIIQIIQEIE